MLFGEIQAEGRDGSLGLSAKLASIPWRPPNGSNGSHKLRKWRGETLNPGCLCISEVHALGWIFFGADAAEPVPGSSQGGENHEVSSASWTWETPVSPQAQLLMDAKGPHTHQ